MALPNLLFIDTNVWLDFYRARNETGLQLLSHVEAVADRIVVNFQLEAEFTSVVTQNRPTIKPGTLTLTRGPIASVSMSNVLSEEKKQKKQQVIAPGKLGWPLRRIEKFTGVRRETAVPYPILK